MSETQRTSSEEARRVGDAIGVDWTRFELEQFRAGMDVEFEHGAHDPQTDVTHDDPIVTGKIALAHMKEFPDYYERLERMERRPSATGPRGCPSAGVRARVLTRPGTSRQLLEADLHEPAGRDAAEDRFLARSRAAGPDLHHERAAVRQGLGGLDLDRHPAVRRGRHLGGGVRPVVGQRDDVDERPAHGLRRTFQRHLLTVTVNVPPGLPNGLGENFTDGISRWSGLAVSSSTGIELLFLPTAA